MTTHAITQHFNPPCKKSGLIATRIYRSCCDHQQALYTSPTARSFISVSQLDFCIRNFGNCVCILQLATTNCYCCNRGHQKLSLGV